MRKRAWTDEKLKEVVAQCFSFNDVIQTLGLTRGANNFTRVKRRVEELGCDTSHFRRVSLGNTRYSDTEVFCKDSKIIKVRPRALQVVKPYKCAECQNIGEHNGKPLTLQLDHINGDPRDNRLKNLRWMCPNCHSQTATYAGRNQ